MKHRLALILPAHLLMYGLCYYVSYLLRFEFALSPGMLSLFWMSLPFVLLIKFASSLITGEWRRSFRYMTFADVIYVASGATLSAALLYGLNWTLLAGFFIPRSVILIDWALTTLAGGFLRSSYRFYNDAFRPLFAQERKERAIIYSSNRTGMGILRALQATNTNYRVVGFIDDCSDSCKSLMSGLPVLPSKLGWSRLIKQFRARHVLIPSTVSGKHVRKIFQECSEIDVKAHVIPGVDEIVEGRYKLQIRDVTISDLLRREPAELDRDKIRDYVTDRRVLVTGAAGSIGSELCRQILELNPSSMVLVDQSELGIFNMVQELRNQADIECPLHFFVSDVVDRPTLQQIMEEHRPELVFHAAAYKHVPLMEEHPQQAVRNNVLGTKTVADLAHEFEVERFVLISTDKAVRPTSVMGSTKLISEKYLQALATISQTQFVTVRFGNVLNSAGSVVPTFRKQIEAGGPITVTHPDMERFFMTIPEAVQLVLQAGAIGASGDVLILEMGNPVKIVDLAKDMICLSGLKYPDDIDIVFSGIRPGEKLYEELFYGTEEGAKKIHDKIFCAGRQGLNLAEVKQDIALLEQAAFQSRPEVLQAIHATVDKYIAADGEDSEGLQSAA